MNKLYCIKNQEEFQGQKYLLKAKDYFEGWYFKIVGNNGSVAIIPGINLNSKKKKAFIQLIINDQSYYIHFDMKDFKVHYRPFQIQIGNNYFSEEKISLQIEDISNDLYLTGEIQFSHQQRIKKNFYYPNIMGPYSYLPFMECNHAIINIKNTTHGSLTVNEEILNFDSGIGYIEKDWGTSFPEKYIWCQGNNFQTQSASFMLAIATVPLFFFKMRGLICILNYQNKEYRFATYNFAKIKKFKANDNEVNITLKKGKYTLTIKCFCNSSQKLVAPVCGKMEKEILESISASMSVTLRKKDQIIFSDTCENCGLEIVSE